MERQISRAFGVGKQEGDRLREIADGVIALAEQPFRDARLLHRPPGESPNGNQPLRATATQKPDRPRGVGRLGRAEVLDHRVDLLVRAPGLVDRGKETREPSHAEISSPATSTGSVSSSPFHWLATALASMPRSVSQRKSGASAARGALT